MSEKQGSAHSGHERSPVEDCDDEQGAGDDSDERDGGRRPEEAPLERSKVLEHVSFG